MAKKNTSMEIYDVPATLQEHPFYGLRLDEHQKVFRDAIWDTEKLIVFCNAKAGTGKTLIATVAAEPRCRKIDGVVCRRAPRNLSQNE